MAVPSGTGATPFLDLRAVQFLLVIYKTGFIDSTRSLLGLTGPAFSSSLRGLGPYKICKTGLQTCNNKNLAQYIKISNKSTTARAAARGALRAPPANPWGSVEPVWKTLTRQFPWVLPTLGRSFQCSRGKVRMVGSEPLSLLSRAPQLSDVCHLRARRESRPALSP